MSKAMNEIINKYGDIETFIDASISQEDQEFAVAIGDSKEVESESLNEKTFNKLHLSHFFKDNDYIITISPEMVQKNVPGGKPVTVPAGKFKIAQEQIITAMAIMLDKHLPRTVNVTLIPPDKDWEIEEYAAKIVDARDAWQLSDELLKTASEDMAGELSKYI